MVKLIHFGIYILTDVCNVCVCVFVFVCVCVSMYVCICVCVLACVRVSVYDRSQRDMVQKWEEIKRQAGRDARKGDPSNYKWFKLST